MSPFGIFTISQRFYRQVFFTIPFLYGVMLFLGLSMGWGAAARENGIIENVQAILLTISLVLFAIAALKSQGAVRMIGVGWMLIMLNMLLRELDIRYLGRDNWLFILLKDHRSNDIEYLLMILLLGIYACRDKARSMQAISYGWSRNFRPFILGLALLLTGQGFEAIAIHSVSRAAYDFYDFHEEAFETFGYFVFFSLACQCWRRTMQQP